MTVEVSYRVLVTAGQVLARQKGHCLEMGARITRLSGQIGATCADQVERSVTAYVGADQRTHERFASIAGQLGTGVTPWGDPSAATGRASSAHRWRGETPVRRSLRSARTSAG